MKQASWYQKDENRSMLLVLLIFLCCGLIHVGLYAVPYAVEVVRIFCGTVALIWVHSIRERIINLRVQHILTGIGHTFLLLFLLQICNYHIFDQVDINRNIEYAYYVPIIMIPLQACETALYLNVEEDGEVSPRWHWLWLPAALLILLFLTNDLHQGVFAFPEELTRTDYSHHVLGYWAFVVWAAVLLITSLGVFIQKCRLPQNGLRMVLPLLPVVVGIILLLLQLFGIKPRLLGVQIWNIGEIYALMGLGFLEACIQNGFIPSNQHYRRIFSLLNIPARIESTKDRSCYSAAGAQSFLEAGEDWQLNVAPISGGQVSWLVDLRNLHRLDHELETTVEQLESRNSLLQSETAIREEKAQHDARNRIYSHIAQAVQPQLEAVEMLLEAHPEAEPDILARIAVLNAYIKRRGNLELLAQTTGQISSQELMLAIHESLVYARLCGVEAYADCSQAYPIPSPMMIEAYAGFEQLLERLLDELLAMAVYVFADSREVRLRINCRVKNGDIQEAVLTLPFLLECQRDVNDLTITLSFSAGGEAS